MVIIGDHIANQINTFLNIFDLILRMILKILNVQYEWCFFSNRLEIIESHS